MLNKNAKKWVKALKSGKYRKGTNYLHPKGNRFCCLGVACDLYIKEHKKNGWQPNDISNEGASFLGEAGTLPRVVRNWLGLRTNGGHFGTNEYDDLSSLFSLNDEYKWSFKRIAEFISKEPAGLFK